MLVFGVYSTCSIEDRGIFELAMFVYRESIHTELSSWTSNDILFWHTLGMLVPYTAQSPLILTQGAQPLVPKKTLNFA